MRRMVAVLGFAVALTLTLPETVRGQGPLASFAIENVTVLDLGTGNRLADQTVVVVGNTITEVGASAGIEPTPAMRPIDGRGKFLIPGMWEIHAHSLEHYGVDYSYGMEAFQLYIANGVTGVRDMGSSLDQLIVGRQRIGNLGVVAPRIFASGPMLEGSAESRFAPFTKVVTTPEAGRLAVNALAEAGVDFLKIHNALSRETYFAITEEATIIGIDYSGHVPEDVTAVEAAAANQNSIEHLGSITAYCTIEGSQDSSEFDGDRCEAGLQQLWLNGTFLGPTLVGSNPLTVNDPRVADERLQYVKASKKATWNSLGAEASPEALERYELAQGLTLMAVEAGVRLLPSTDTGAPYRIPGFAAVDEIIEFVEAGVSPLEALRAGTIYPVISLRLEQALGSIEPGKLADMVLLEGDPLEDIENIKRIAAVVSDGRVFEEAERQALLENVRAAAAR